MIRIFSANLPYKQEQMLLQFTVHNFRSFRDEAFLTTIPANLSGKEEHIAAVNEEVNALKSCILYGPNASGKSNLIKAIQALQSMVIHSNEVPLQGTINAYRPFLFDATSRQSPVSFTIDFTIDDIRYHYHLAFLAKEIITENLAFYPQGRLAKLFERKGQQFIFGDYLKGPKKAVESVTAPNQLFLSKGAVNNIPLLAHVYEFFRTQLQTVQLTDNLNQNRFTQSIAKRLLIPSEGLFRNNFLALVKALDTGITDFDIRSSHAPIEAHIAAEPLPSYRPKTHRIFAVHPIYQDGQIVGEDILPLEEESIGTQKLFTLAGLFLNALEYGTTIILDEFERSIHPLISRYLLSLFHHPDINKNNAQLIAATHDTTLLESHNHLRRDQVWIVEKDQQGVSELFSLADIKGVRPEVPFDQWYLTGRFGGIPTVQSLDFEYNFELNETQTSETKQDN